MLLRFSHSGRSFQPLGTPETFEIEQQPHQIDTWWCISGNSSSWYPVLGEQWARNSKMVWASITHRTATLLNRRRMFSSTYKYWNWHPHGKLTFCICLVCVKKGTILLTLVEPHSTSVLGKPWKKGSKSDSKFNRFFFVYFRHELFWNFGKIIIT